MKRKYNENRKISMKEINFKKALREYIELIDKNEKTQTVDRDEIIEFYKKGNIYKFLLSCTAYVIHNLSRYNLDIYMMILNDDEMCKMLYVGNNTVNKVILEEIINEKSI